MSEELVTGIGVVVVTAAAVLYNYAMNRHNQCENCLVYNAPESELTAKECLAICSTCDGTPKRGW